MTDGLHALKLNGTVESETRVFLAETEAAVAASRGARRKLRAILETTGRIYAGDSVLGRALAGNEELSIDGVARSAVEVYEVTTLLSGGSIVDAVRLTGVDVTADGGTYTVEFRIDNEAGIGDKLFQLVGLSNDCQCYSRMNPV